VVFIPHDCIFYRLTEKQKKTTLWKQKPSTGECLHQCCFELSRISSSVSILLKDRSEREMFSISVKKNSNKNRGMRFRAYISFVKRDDDGHGWMDTGLSNKTYDV